ncbi:hypothetical protein [Allosphingosinicella sp.]|jgi:hypothetical protein|uniref:hypothetical protein n=1 Tax=Allosphingosinicella sp. TaxID=2823234 RepID=UPI002F173684
MIFVSLALAAAVPPAFEVVDQAGSRVDMLGVRGLQWWEPREPSAPHCSEGAAPSWCVSASRTDDSGWTLTVSNAAASRTARVRLPGPERASFIVWSQLVRGADGSILAGVVRTDRGPFSGGGWQKDRLILVRVTAESEGIVLDLPLLGSAAIRACFDGRDRRRRRGACTDDYSFSTAFSLDTANASSTPALSVSTRAETYPGRRSRSVDSSRGRPLRRQDLSHWHDPVCSYERRYRFHPAAGRYLPDTPVPACADYLEFE